MAIFNGASKVRSWSGKYEQVLLLEEDTAFTDASVIDVTNLATLIQESLTALPLAAVGYANDTPERSYVTTSCNYSFAEEEANPEITLSLNSNEVDYNELRSRLDGKIVWLLAYPKGDKQVHGVRRSDGSIHGFEAKLYFKTSAAEADAKQENAYKLNVKFQDVEEWKSKAIKPITYPFSTIENLTPAGYEMSLTSSYNTTSGEITALVQDRAEYKGVTGLVLADFRTENDGVLDSGVTAITEVGNGYYTLIIQKAIGGTPAAMVSGEKLDVTAFKQNAAKYTHKANVVTLAVD